MWGRGKRSMKKLILIRYLIATAIALVLICLSGPSARADYDEELWENLEAAFRAAAEEDYDRALDLYTKVIRDRNLTARDRAVAFLLRGEVQMSKGDYDQAILDFARALKIKPNYSEALFLMGLSYEKKGKLEQAYRKVNEALSFRPDDEEMKARLEILKAKMAQQGLEIPEQ